MRSGSGQPGSRSWTGTEPGATSSALAPNPALSPVRAIAGRNADQALSPEAGKTRARTFSGGAGSCGSLPRQAAVGPQPALTPPLPPGLPSPPTEAGLGFGKETVTANPFGTWSPTVTPPCRRVINLRSFFKTSPTCLLLNVRVMGSASDKTAYYS